MTNHYLKICPRGFANEVLYLRVRENEIDDAEKIIEQYRDDTSGYAEWTADKAARIPGKAVDFADRHWIAPELA